jgi:pyruvate-formate lyase-activating enzyme
VKRDARLQLVATRHASIFWIEFADQWDAKSPWHDKRLRQAVNYALDRKTINEAEAAVVAKSEHWAFQPVRNPATPTVKDASWSRTPIDPFILARLEQNGLTPSPQADRRTLLRRVSFDLTGLPPTPDEIADMAVGHIERVHGAVVSFGQGCEGEPLLGRDLLPLATRAIRARTPHGTVNVNTNGSLPAVVEAMCREGLDAIRVSMNSARTDVYETYYRPKKYTFDDVRETLRVMKRYDRYRSINYLVYPGLTDTEGELEAISAFVEDAQLDLIQMRNLNIDPMLYRERMPAGTVKEGFGMREFMRRLSARFPHLHYGYFNPPKETYARWRAART